MIVPYAHVAELGSCDPESLSEMMTLAQRVEAAFRANYSPDGMQEKVAHAMSGYLLVNQKELRLRHLEGNLPQDLSIGFGILATVHAGTHFVTERSEVGDEWRTTHVVSVLNGRVIFFKTLSKNQDMVRQQFHKLEKPLTLKEAVALAESAPQ